MDIENVVVGIIGIFGVLLVILAMAEFYGGEWETVAQNVSLVIVAIVVFAGVIGGIVYWRR